MTSVSSSAPSAARAATMAPAREAMMTSKFFIDIVEPTIVDRHDVAPRSERLLLPPELYRSGAIGAWLKAMTGGRDELWYHQAKSLDLVAQGHNVLVETGTASGKSLVFQAEIVRRLLADPATTMLVLYPQKALSSDQRDRWTTALA